MFVQVIKGKTSDPDALRARFDDWKTQLSGSAQGWQGTTAGVAEDGTFVALVEFESAEAARANSDRDEQGEWWSQTEPLLDNVEFNDAEEVLTMFGGPAADAGFVQVMEEQVTDMDKAKAFMAEAEKHLPQNRPDVVGGLIAVHGDTLTQAMDFPDEASARAGESAPMPPEMQAQMDEMGSVFEVTSYIDIREPWLERA